jgi:hypothetical protein
MVALIITSPATATNARMSSKIKLGVNFGKTTRAQGIAYGTGLFKSMF